MTAKNASACSNETLPASPKKDGQCPDASRASRMRDLNDSLRKTGRGGKVQFTTGIAQRNAAFVRAVINAVIAFDAFTEDNDPFGEHDCACLTVLDQRILWKIDYYDRQLEFHSIDPANSKVTVRVLTVMLAEEY